MAALEYVIGVNARDAADLAHSLNLPRRSVITSTEAIGGRRPARVHLTSGFWKRRDLPSVAAALRNLLYTSPKTQILGYDDRGAHDRDLRLTPRATWVTLPLGTTVPEPLPREDDAAPAEDDELIRPGEEEQPLPSEPASDLAVESDAATEKPADDDPFGMF